MKQAQDPSILLSSKGEPDSSRAASKLPYSPGKSSTWFRPETESHIERVRPKVLRRWAIVAMIIFSLCVLLAATGWIGSAKQWLAGQPEHQIDWDEIQLNPEPPRYIRSGKSGLLSAVKKRLGSSASLSGLTQDLAEFARTFPLGSPWVEEVSEIRVEGYPNQLLVKLAYRTPCAILNLGGSNGTKILLDEHGVVIPYEDFDSTQSTGLMRIDGWNGDLEARPGLALASNGSPEEQQLQAATRLSSFVKGQGDQESSKVSVPLLQAINLRYGPKQLFAQTREGLWVLWGEAPGEESAGQLTAEEKWNFLVDWLARNPSASNRAGTYLFFTRKGAVIQAPKRAGSEPRATSTEADG